MRPGFGAAKDPWRIAESRKIYAAGLTFINSIQNRVEWLVLWQRAGGEHASPILPVQLSHRRISPATIARLATPAAQSPANQSNRRPSGLAPAPESSPLAAMAGAADEGGDVVVS